MPWEALPETYRRANRRQALSIGAALDRLGLSVVAGTTGVAAVDLTNDEEESLAIAEHERWVNERLRDGWRYAPAPKDVTAKTNPSLQGWDQIEEGTREINRQTARALSGLLTSHGLAIVRRGNR